MEKNFADNMVILKHWIREHKTTFINDLSKFWKLPLINYFLSEKQIEIILIKKI